MSEWKYLTLNQMGKIARGKSKHRPRNDPRLYGGRYPFIQTADVKAANLYLTSYSQTYNEDGLAQSKLWPEETLCITIAANIADTAILSFPACFPDSIMGFQADNNVCLVRYVKYCFDILQAKCKQISQGAAQDNLSWERLSSIEFPVPAIELQIKICSILSSYDELIENNRKEIKLLEEAAQRLYKEWFIDFKFPGHETTPIDPETNLPEGWKRGTIGDRFSINTGKRDANYGTSDGHYPFFTCAQEPIKAPGYSFETEAIILAGNGDLYSRLFRGKFEAYQRTYVIEPFDSEYLFLGAHCIDASMRVLKNRAAGSTIKYLTKGMIESIDFVIPTLKIQEQFTCFCESVQSKVEKLQKQVAHLQEARHRLLPKLMSGEIEVN